MMDIVDFQKFFRQAGIEFNKGVFKPSPGDSTEFRTLELEEKYGPHGYFIHFYFSKFNGVFISQGISTQSIDEAHSGI
jgi:hypothetical protein